MRCAGLRTLASAWGCRAGVAYSCSLLYLLAWVSPFLRCHGTCRNSVEMPKKVKTLKFFCRSKICMHQSGTFRSYKQGSPVCFDYLACLQIERQKPVKPFRSDARRRGAMPIAQCSTSQVKSLQKQETIIRKPIECASEASSGGREWADRRRTGDDVGVPSRGDTS